MILAAIIVGTIALFALVVGASAIVLSGQISEDEREHCRRRHQSD